jgi:hypothetical protein
LQSAAENLGSAREQLLDVSLRNKLINFTPLKLQGLDILTMSFFPAPCTRAGQPKELPRVFSEWRSESRRAYRQPEGLLPSDAVSRRAAEHPSPKHLSSSANIDSKAGRHILLALGMNDWYEESKREVLQSSFQYINGRSKWRTLSTSQRPQRLCGMR